MASLEESLAELTALSPLLKNLNISADTFDRSKRRPKKKTNTVSSNPLLAAIERAGNPSLSELDSESIDENENEEVMEAASIHFQLPRPKQIFTDHSILRLSFKPILNIVEYKNVEFGSKEFKKISAKFTPRLYISKIQRIDNPFLKKSFQLTRHFKYSDQEPLQLFHGTKRDYVKSICTGNFNWRFTGIERGHKHGRGVNFTTKPLFAFNFCDKGGTDPKVIILADVLVKNKCLGDKNLVVPPQGYDTTMRKDSRVFVKFSDAEFYPAYLIYLVKIKNVKPSNKLTLSNVLQ